jgi:hypothetical protein
LRDLFPRIERLVTDSFIAVHKKVDPKRCQNGFEIFGYDFMIDHDFKVYMIEANTNPSLEICCPLLSRIIPELLDNSFRIAIDPLFQPSYAQDESLPSSLPQTSNGRAKSPREKGSVVKEEETPVSRKINQLKRKPQML